jgi:crotonobetainyl-CoA:carnitine CoA-transferase CaiB-like acyl-CoA transferase
MSTPVAPLAGIRVVSLAEQFPGPFATLLLGDLGADVVQVERPTGGDPSRAFPGLYEALNRGKRSVALDLKDADGAAAFGQLIAQADVLLEGFRPGVLARLGFGPDELLPRHPRLVYVSVSGFGQDSPLRNHPAHDLTYQAMAGLLDSGQSEPPQTPVLSLADLSAGMFAAFAALSGVLAAKNTGRGGHYDVAMFDTLLTFAATRLVPRANGQPADTLGLDPGYGLFATADGTWISLSIAFEDHFWKALCVALNLPDLADVSADTRVDGRERLRSVIAARILERPVAHWDEVLLGSGVPYGRVNTLEDLLDDPNVAARHMIQSIPTRDGQRSFVRQPLIVDGVPHGPTRGTPRLGEHTAEVLTQAGVPPDLVDRVASTSRESPVGGLY